MSDREKFTSHLLGGPWTLRRREVAKRVGVSLLSARKIWRALGFPGVDDDEVAFNETDARALGTTVGMVRHDLIDEETAIACARALGQTTDRLVSWQIDALLEYLASRSPSGRPEDPLKLIEQLTPELEELLLYSFRRQLAASISRIDASSGRPADAVTVCFADLVAYTRLSRRLPRRDLSRLVQRFEGLASDVVTAGGGRVIKTVGDEVLFIATDATKAALIALSISARMADDDLVPDVRVGMVHGPVLRSLGDVYGTTVNLASRLTSLAEPGTVVTDPFTAKSLEDHPGIELVAQRPRLVRGFGQVQPLLVAPMGISEELITVD